MMNTNMTISLSMFFGPVWKAVRHVYKKIHFDPGFTEMKNLIVCLEEGEEEYDEDFLKNEFRSPADRIKR